MFLKEQFLIALNGFRKIKSVYKLRVAETASMAITVLRRMAMVIASPSITT